MSLLRSASSALTGLFVATAAQTAPPTEALAGPVLKIAPDETKYSLTLGARGGCEKLLPRDCDGDARRIEIRAGNWFFGYENFDETAQRVAYDRSESLTYRGHMIADGRAALDWRINTNGYKFIIDRNFNVTDNLHVKLGGYIGRISGMIDAHADVRATLHSQHITSSEQNFRGITIPAIDLRTPELTARYHEDWYKAARSWFGGLQASAGWSIPVSTRATAGLSTYGQFGVERVRYGGGAEMIFTSSPDEGVGAHPGGPCQRGQGGGHLLSRAKLAFSIGACVDVVARDMLEDKKIEFAKRQVATANRHLGRMQEYIDQAEPYVRSVPQMPTVSDQQAVDFFGFYEDYKKPRTSLVASFMVRVTNSSALTLSYRHPVGARFDKPQLDATFTHGF